MRDGGDSRQMKNIYEVLKQKEDDLKALQVEVDALRIAARLLKDDDATTMTSEPATKFSPVARPASAVHSVAAPAGSYSAAWGNAPRQFP